MANTVEQNSRSIAVPQRQAEQMQGRRVDRLQSAAVPQRSRCRSDRRTDRLHSRAGDWLHHAATDASADERVDARAECRAYGREGRTARTECHRTGRRRNDEPRGGTSDLRRRSMEIYSSPHNNLMSAIQLRRNKLFFTEIHQQTGWCRCVTIHLHCIGRSCVLLHSNHL